MIDADLHALSGAYAVDAVDAAERRAFERHLAGCPSCTDEVRELRATAAVLGTAAADRPPAALRGRILAEIGNVRQLPPETPADRPASDGRRGEEPGAVAPEPAPVAPTAPTALTPSSGAPSGAPSAIPAPAPTIGGTVVQGPWRRRARVLAALAAALLAVVVGLAVLSVDLNRRLDRVERQNAVVAAVLAAPDARVRGTGSGGGATATATVSPSQGRAVFTAAGLPAIPGSRTYQLWAIGAGGIRSAGLLTRGDDGQAVAVVDGDLARTAQLAVSVEPAGGSPQPTVTPTLAVRL